MAKYRANAQDTWKELKIKALDSMPVGTMVEFAGGTIPSGWTQVNDYSTDEIDTGKTWIDGKEIYRIVLDTTSPSSTGSEAVIGTIGEISQLITLNAMVDLGQYGFAPIPQYVSSSSYNVIYLSNKTTGAISMNVSNSVYTSKPTIVIIEYTKTTNQE